MNLRELKRKYSGQAIPEWELKQVEAVAEKPRKKAERPALKTEDEPTGE